MPPADSPFETFKSALASDVSTGIAAMQGLMQVLRQSGANTLQELVSILKAETDKFMSVDCSAIALTSACELFLRFITLAHTQLESQDFNACLQLMLERGKSFMHKLEEAKGKISASFLPFVPDGGSVLVHGRSRVVLSALTHAARHGKEFHVYLTKSGEELKKQLQAENIATTVIDDMAIGFFMNKVECVLLGAEGVCESGGIVNQLGTLPLSIVAKQTNKPVYTLVESFKFVRVYPLSQDDLPVEYLYPGARTGDGKDYSSTSPKVDYTEPSLLTLLFTDLGILTPSAVSDELIKLYL